MQFKKTEHESHESSRSSSLFGFVSIRAIRVDSCSRLFELAETMAKRTAQSDPPMLRGKLWLDRDGRAVVTEHSVDLLEQIDACGSLSEAARRLRFAYRRAWLMLDAMNTAWPTPVAITATGGKQGGGATLTERGRHVVRAYRDLQVQLEHLIDSAGEPFEM